MSKETARELPVRRGEMLQVTIERTGLEGKSIARYNEFVLFVNGGIPGDVVSIQIQKVKGTYAEARLVDVVSAGPGRTEPGCHHFGTCGGCKWQHFGYSHQLEAKREHVMDAMQRIGGFKDLTVLPTLGSPRETGYRNKMDFTFSDNRWLLTSETAGLSEKPSNFALGLHVPGRFDKIVDIDHCLLQSPVANRLLEEIKAFSLDSGFLPWSIKSHHGFWRSMIIRQAAHTADLMVILVTTVDDRALLDRLATRLTAHFPEITSLIQITHSGPGPVPRGEGTRILAGKDHLEEMLGGIRFRIHPESFFQTNTYQAEKLFETAFRMAQLTGNDHLYDLFCGPGTIGLLAARSVRKVVGMEIRPEAVENAKENARLNGITNADFFCGDLSKQFDELDSWSVQYGQPDIVVVDPPRAGLPDALTRKLPSLGADRIIYISCNPVTQARDMSILREARYLPGPVQPVDMFPHTWHIESIVVMTRS